MKPLTIISIIFAFFCSLKGEEIKSDEINYAELEKSNSFKSELFSKWSKSYKNRLNFQDVNIAFKIDVSRWSNECFYQFMNEGDILHVVVAVIYYITFLSIKIFILNSILERIYFQKKIYNLKDWIYFELLGRFFWKIKAAKVASKI